LGRNPQSLPTLTSGARQSGFIVFHPRYRAWLVRNGIDTATDALELPGEIVCGHPDRHVVRVELARRVVYLKREHLIGWRTRFKNWRAGFGWVSRSVREAVTLRRLEAAGMPSPQWLAYGEDGHGRAFLLVDELTDSADLRAVLSDTRLSPEDRRVLAERAGRVIAELHEAGFGTPELAAKHVLVGRRPLSVNLLDWQSCPLPGTVSDADRARQLATLTASLAGELATTRERLRFAWAYLRTVRQSRKAEKQSTPRFVAFLRDVLANADRLRNRSSVRDQRQAAGPPQRLVWLTGEEVCAVPDIAAVWPTPAVTEPFYAAARPRSRETEVTLPDGRRAVLARFRTFAPAARVVAGIRGKSWRSPGAKLARILFHLERYGIAGPRLLAFGQRLTGPATADSFVLYETIADVTPTTETREILAKLRAAGCEVVPAEAALGTTPDGRVVVMSPFAVRLSKRVTPR
jgi:tRNA A-37 threonylcarbamoyl transferase component Bud32